MSTLERVERAVLPILMVCVVRWVLEECMAEAQVVMVIHFLRVVVPQVAEVAEAEEVEHIRL